MKSNGSITAAPAMRRYARAMLAMLIAIAAIDAQAAIKCEDGSTAGAANECPDAPTPVTPVRDSSFVSQTLPTTMVVGQTYAATVVMKNTGTSTWLASQSYNLGSQNPGDNTTWGLHRVATPASTATNASATFKFSAKAPLTAGTYNFRWRMVQDGVAWFGALTPNLSVQVLPSVINGIVDGLSGNNISGWACSTRLNSSINVQLYIAAPAGSGTLQGTYKATNASDASVATACLSSGTNYRYYIPITDGMVRAYGGQLIYIHGVSPVGATNSAVTNSGKFRIPAASRDSAFVSQSVPATMNIGVAYPVTVTFKNTGNVSWLKSESVRLGSANPLDNSLWGLSRVELPADVAPGASVSFTFNVTSKTYGKQNFQWQMLREGSAWFGATSTNQVVDVIAPPTVALTAPANGAINYAPANVTLRATASDVDGSIASVAFYNNGALAGTVTSSPYQLALTGLATGSYRFTAVAKDSQGLSTESAAVNYSVRTAQGPVKVARSYVYDAYKQLCKVIEPETGATVMDYDADGQMIWSAAGLDLPSTTSCDREAAYASGRRVDRGYDARGRLATLRFPDRNGDQDWSYTADGLPSTVTTWNDAGASTVVNSYVYNRRRLLTGESAKQSDQASAWSLGYGYDGIGNPASQVYPSNLTVTYAPNALGQPTQIRDGAGTTYASGFSYYPNGAVKQFTYGNGVVHTLALNARQMPLQVRDAGIAAYEYAYDANGNVTAIYDQQQGDNYSRTMQYDGLDRLVVAKSTSFGGDGSYRYAYDALDNLQSVKLGGVRQDNYWYDASNRLTSLIDDSGVTTMGLSYDSQGNLANRNGQLYGFDFGNRLREVASIESYRYDASGRRVLAARAGSGNNLSMYGQGGQLYYEQRADKGAMEYIYFNGSVLAVREAGIVDYQHTDALGSPVATTSAAGKLVERTQYTPYGGAIGKVVDGIGYTGHVMDGGTGLIYMQQRYSDPEIGRFLSVDPVTAYSNPIGAFNRYWYASNSPYNFKDLDGRESGAAFRVINNMTNGGPVSPPARSPDDWLGPAIGVALTGVLSAPAVGYAGAAALANPATANAVITGAADIAMGDAIGGASLAGASAIAISAKEIISINKTFGGTTELLGSAESVIANMGYREGLFDKAATAIRDIAGGHLFDNGNKRTAQAIAEKMLGSHAEPSTIRSVIDQTGRGELRNVEDISENLQR